MSTDAIPQDVHPPDADPLPTPAQLRLLDAAIDAFAESGFGGTTTRDIAARAGKSPAAVYIHYRTKEDVLFAVSRLGHLSALNCLSEAAHQDATPTERIYGMVTAFSRWHMDHAKLGRVAQYEFAAMTDEHRTAIAELRRRCQQVVRAVIHDGIAAGEFEVDDVSGAADAVLSLSIDLVRWFDPARNRDPVALAAQHAELAVRMVRGCRSSPVEPSPAVEGTR